MNDTTTVIIPASEIEAVHTESGLTVERFTTIRAGFAGHFTELASILEAAKQVTVLKPKAARAIRLELRALRSAADKTRKELKDNALKEGRAIDGLNKVLIAHASPVEDEMEAIEKAEEIAAAKAREALVVERGRLLAPYADPSIYPLGDLTEEQFKSVLETLKGTHERKLEQERQRAEAEAKRVAEEAAERERLRAENERMRAENERLAKIAEQERAARAEAEREAAAAAAAKAEERRLENEARDRHLAEVDAFARKLEAEQMAAAAKAKADADAAIAALEEKGRREYAEAKAKIDAAEKAAADAKFKAETEHAAKVRAEQEAEAKAERARKKAAAAPDAEKVRSLAKMIRVIPIPKLSDGSPLQQKIADQVSKFAAWLESEAEKLT
jgi:hypothetical protein